MFFALQVFDAINNNEPTANTPTVIRNISRHCGRLLSDIPHRTTVEAMARELGSVADLQAAEVLMKNKHCTCTLGFDATTQEGAHVNSVHITTKTAAYSVAVDELPGGTAQDYHEHITQSLDNLASVYSSFLGEDFKESCDKLITNISNTITDRCVANHAIVTLLNKTWGKKLTELNCHLHPLDTIAKDVGKELKQVEKECGLDKDGKLYGVESLAERIVLVVNKLRYKDGPGYPKGFKAFLESNGLPRGLLPRNRGNRLHVLIKIAGNNIIIFSQYLYQGFKIAIFRFHFFRNTAY